jgi:hypothetical protein
VKSRSGPPNVEGSGCRHMGVGVIALSSGI